MNIEKKPYNQTHLRLMILWQVAIYPVYFLLFAVSPELFGLFLLLERPLYFFRSKENYMETLFDQGAQDHPQLIHFQVFLLFYTLVMFAGMYFLSNLFFMAVLSAEVFDFILLTTYRIIKKSRKKQSA